VQRFYFKKLGCRVPHLRDGFIVAKVGIRVQHDPLSLAVKKSQVSALNAKRGPKARSIRLQPSSQTAS
jgi:hypothetical protein